MKRALPFLLPSLFILLAAGALWSRSQPQRRPPMEDPRDLATYGDLHTLTSTGPLALSDLRDKVVVVYFGYTSCPDICPTTLATMGRAFHALSPAEQERSALLFISVDPERDKVDRLAEYAAYFHPSFRGATASPEAIATMARDWGVSYRRVESEGSAMAYTVDHSTQSFLVGRGGRMTTEIPHGTPPDRITELLRQALQ